MEKNNHKLFLNRKIYTYAQHTDTIIDAMINLLCENKSHCHHTNQSFSYPDDTPHNNAVLSVQNLQDGIDVIGLQPDHVAFHSRLSTLPFPVNDNHFLIKGFSYACH